MKKNKSFAKSRQAKASPIVKAQKGAVNTHSSEGAMTQQVASSGYEEVSAEERIVRKAYELAPEWKISVIAKRKFMALPRPLQNGAGKEACVKDALAGHKDLIPDATRYWLWMVDETAKLKRVWDFQETCKKAERDPQTVAQHLILEGKAVCNAVRMEGLEAYGSNIRMFVEPLFHDEFRLFGDMGKIAKPQVAEVKEEEVAHE